MAAIPTIRAPHQVTERLGRKAGGGRKDCVREWRIETAAAGFHFGHGRQRRVHTRVKWAVPRNTANYSIEKRKEMQGKGWQKSRGRQSNSKKESQGSGAAPFYS